MKAITKLLADFVTWRWAPTVGLLSAALLYVLVVVGLVPTEFGVPVANAKLSPRTLPTAAGAGTSTAALSTAEPEAAPVEHHAAAHPAPQAPAEFGRRGFSPPLERPEPPPAPPPPPAPVIPVAPPPVVAAAAAAAPTAPEPPADTPPAAASAPNGPLGGRLGGMFQGLSGAMRNRLGGLNGQRAPSDSTAPQAPPEGQPPAEGQPPPGQPPPVPGQPQGDGEARPVPAPQ